MKTTEIQGQCTLTKSIECTRANCAEFSYCEGNAVVTSQCGGATPFCAIGITSDYCRALRDPDACGAGDSSFECTGVGQFPGLCNKIRT